MGAHAPFAPHSQSGPTVLDLLESARAWIRQYQRRPDRFLVWEWIWTAGSRSTKHFASRRTIYFAVALLRLNRRLLRLRVYKWRSNDSWRPSPAAHHVRSHYRQEFWRAGFRKC